MKKKLAALLTANTDAESYWFQKQAAQGAASPDYYIIISNPLTVNSVFAYDPDSIYHFSLYGTSGRRLRGCTENISLARNDLPALCRHLPYPRNNFISESNPVSYLFPRPAQLDMDAEIRYNIVAAIHLAAAAMIQTRGGRSYG